MGQSGKPASLTANGAVTHSWKRSWGSYHAAKSGWSLDDVDDWQARWVCGFPHFVRSHRRRRFFFPFQRSRFSSSVSLACDVANCNSAPFVCGTRLSSYGTIPPYR